MAAASIWVSDVLTMAIFATIWLRMLYTSMLMEKPMFQKTAAMNPPMPDSKSAQSWHFFSILEISNFLGFQNVFSKLHEPS